MPFLPRFPIRVKVYPLNNDGTLGALRLETPASLYVAKPYSFSAAGSGPPPLSSARFVRFLYVPPGTDIREPQNNGITPGDWIAPVGREAFGYFVWGVDDRWAGTEYEYRMAVLIAGGHGAGYYPQIPNAES